MKILFNSPLESALVLAWILMCIWCTFIYWSSKHQTMEGKYTTSFLLMVILALVLGMVIIGGMLLPIF